MEPESVRKRYLKVDTATVADVLDTLGLPNQGLAPEFAPYPPSAGRMAGWAYTIRGKMARYAASGDPRKMKAVDGVIAIPARVTEKVLLEAERLTKKEIRIRRELDRGATLQDVLAKYGHV